MGERAMALHVQEADRLGHNGIGCEHLLLGVLATEESAVARVLVAHGLTLDLARRRIDEAVGEGWQDAVRWSYSTRATVVCKLAEVEAERLGADRPGNAHLLLAVITEGGGLPMHLFHELEIELDQLREELLDTLNPPSELRELYVRQRRASERAPRRPGSPYVDEG
jgi:ATP-dependent Clp protease ATP-binding subunit ClpC